MSEIKRIDIQEFRERGYLQELNRKFLHPLGLALEVEIHHDGTAKLGGIWDYRDDPGGIRFEGVDLVPYAVAVTNEWFARRRARESELGYMIQPAAVPREVADRG